MKGSSAAASIENFPATAENYPKAVQVLISQFGNEKLLWKFYMRELIKLVQDNCTSKNKNVDLRTMYNKLTAQLRALDSLGNVTRDEFLCPLVESSIPADTLVAWQRSNNYGRDGSQETPPKTELEYLLIFLNSEVQNEKLRNMATGNSTESKKPSNEKKMFKMRERPYNFETPTAASLYSGPTLDCIFCHKAHESDKCGAACKMTLLEKQAKVKENKACFNCLKVGHFGQKCRTFVKCPTCMWRHRPIMCPTIPKCATPSENKSNTISPESNTVLTTANITNQVLLKTLMVRLPRGDGQFHIARVLVDDGSQRSYIKTSTAKLLNLEPVGSETLRTSLFGGAVTNVKEYKRYCTSLFDTQGTCSREMMLLGEGTLVGEVPRVQRGPWLKELRKKGIRLSDSPNQSSEIEILLGSDHISQISTGKVKKLQCGLLATETIFGWAIQGKATKGGESIASTVICSFVKDASISELWDLETLGIRDPAEVKSEYVKEEEAKFIFNSTLKRLEDGRYEVGLPWAEGTRSIPSNRKVAEARLIATTKNLKAKGHYQTYENIFVSWLEEGFIEEVPEDGKEGVHYLPHRPVFKESITTPVRPVFDASCKVGRNPSLNECLYKGPNMIELVPAVLLRFREKEFGITADVKKAFQMISVHKTDRDYLRFLWWKDAENTTIRIFHHARVVFGLNSSPFLLAATIEHHLRTVEEDQKPIAQQLLKSLYVDNCLTSVQTREEAEAFRIGATAIMQKAGMELRQWEMSKNTEEENCITIILGLIWDKSNDTLSCSVPDVLPQGMTKRSVLSQVSKIFDPIGFTAPILIPPKKLLQEAWAANLGWDTELARASTEAFRQWLQELPNLQNVKIPRQAIYTDETGTLQLHLFVDASQDAFAAVVYARTESKNGVKVQLLQAKARVAPLKKITIPRLELMACSIGARLIKEVKAALSYEHVETIMWTDSTTALAWIRRCDTWGTFVGNRVKEILTLTNSDDWNHIPGLKNPADLPSRGCNPKELLESKWWEGPQWLYEAREYWPNSEPTFDEEAICQEKKKTVVACFMNEKMIPEPRFSTYSKNVAVYGWIKRFINNSKSNKQIRVSTSHLTLQEMKQAEMALMQQVQRESILKDVDEIEGLKVSKVNSLYRVETKLTRGKDNEDFKRPIYLPKFHPIVKMLIREIHESYCHAGVQFIMGKIRLKFWIPQCRRTIRSVVQKCARCRRHDATRLEVDVTALPEKRITVGETFQVTGVDLAGPLILKNNSKVWIVLFTCATYRCVHLDLVESLSTDAFLKVLERFINTQGRPNDIFSDNGTNFVGAEHLMRLLDWQKIGSELCVRKICWTFNPPTAAWWGGWWERLVRTIKDLLKRILHTAKLSYEDLLTSLSAVSYTINDRPLTTITEDPDDLNPLKPSMFMRMSHMDGFPEGEHITRKDLQSSYRKMQDVKRQLQSRFRREYLSQLVQRVQKKKALPLRLGEVVFIGMDNVKRIFWQLGRIVELIEGGDGKIRVAKLKTKHGYLTRPLQRLYPMELNSEEIPKIRQVKNLEMKVQDDSEGNDDIVFPVKAPVKTRLGRQIKRPARFLV